MFQTSRITSEKSTTDVQKLWSRNYGAEIMEMCSRNYGVEIMTQKLWIEETGSVLRIRSGCPNQLQKHCRSRKRKVYFQLNTETRLKMRKISFEAALQCKAVYEASRKMRCLIFIN